MTGENPVSWLAKFVFINLYVYLKTGLNWLRRWYRKKSSSNYTDPKWKLYIVFKRIYFDDKLSFGLIFFGHRIFNALSMSLKKLLDANHKLHNFYE